MQRLSVGQLLFVSKIWVCMMLWFLPQQIIRAAELVDLFTVDVPVADRSASKRAAAMKQGLEEVLIRASGINASATNDYLHSRLNKAQSFIQQYAYLKSEDNQAQDPWILHINFEAESIHRLLSDAGVAIWGERRPVVLLWVAQQDGYERHIINRASEYAVQIEKIANRRAIPVQFPLLDLQDNAEVELTDVWGRFSSRIIKASRRYNADIILFGRVYQKIGSRSDDGWLADWQLILEGKRSGWKDNAVTTEKIYQHLFTVLGQRLCNKYCVMASQSADNEILLNVENLNDFIQAATAEKYLESLLPVRDVNLLQLKDNKALFLLRLVSREKSVLEAISLDSALSPLSSLLPVGAEKRIYNYRWTP